MITNKTKYIFSVENAFIDNKSNCDPKLIRTIEQFCKNNFVYLCSYLDHNTLLQLMGRRAVENCYGVFSNGANTIYRGRRLLKNSNLHFSTDLITFLEEKSNKSSFTMKSGSQIQNNSGVITFSVLGKTDNLIEQKRYAAYDQIHNERQSIINEINEKFQNYVAYFAGSTSICILNKNNNKNQIFTYFSENDNITYVGNNFRLHGNDYSISEHARNDKRITLKSVKNWSESYKFMNDVMYRDKLNWRKENDKIRKTS